MRVDDLMYMVVVYKSPKDFKGKYVARKFTFTHEGEKPTDIMTHAKTLATVRGWIRDNFPHLVQVSRSPSDDPVIYESWI